MSNSRSVFRHIKPFSMRVRFYLTLASIHNTSVKFWTYLASGIAISLPASNGAHVYYPLVKTMKQNHHPHLSHQITIFYHALFLQEEYLGTGMLQLLTRKRMAELEHGPSHSSIINLPSH